MSAADRRRNRLIFRILVGAVALATGTASLSAAPPASQVLAQLRQAVQERPTLTGVSIAGGSYQPGEDVFVLRGHVAFSNQVTEVVNLGNLILGRLDDSATAVVSAEQLTVQPPTPAELVNWIQNAAESNLELGGVLVRSAEYVDDASGLVLYGRIAEASQETLLVNLVNEHVLPEHYGQGVPLQVRSSLQVVAPSLRVAEQFFNVGRNQFEYRDYAGARVSFAQAVLEDPQNIAMRYWQVLAELGNGDADAAHRHVRPLVQLRRDSDSKTVSRDVARSLEPVQGTIRQTLRALELRVLAETP